MPVNVFTAGWTQTALERWEEVGGKRNRKFAFKEVETLWGDRSKPTLTRQGAAGGGDGIAGPPSEFFSVGNPKGSIKDEQELGR